MKFRMPMLLLAAAFVSAHVQAADDCSFVKKVELPSRQQVAVVSSGALEPCSTGSYAVRVYSTAHAAPGFDTDDYVTGALHARDGTVTDAYTADLGTRAPQALVVTTRSAGSGGYVGAQAYVTTPRAVRLVASVDGLAPDADIAAALRKAIGKRSGAR
ncbi:PliI family lysozyme inhibitor of I-type lysozyme [Burkholderia pyrrocinia]|uniref:PliI family lysozyme inhibitor of I-type lysozyme n=1 Tax=Burkholderia pyrrocinia TaxID=60550 RepID=A0ABZ3BH02_BURPY